MAGPTSVWVQPLSIKPQTDSPLTEIFIRGTSGGFRGGWGGCIPPTSLKVTILAEKSASISNNSAPVRDASPHQPKPNESGRKITPNFGEDLFFFFFGDHLILGEKKFEFLISVEKSLSISVKTSEFLRFCA